MEKQLTCGCEKNFLCKKAERLWNEANCIYRASGYVKWKESPQLKDYNKHREALNQGREINLCEG